MEAGLALLGVVAASVTVGLVVVRRARREVEPTIRAFDELRAALAPARERLRRDANALGERLDGRPGPPPTRR